MSESVACRLCGAETRFWFSAARRDIYRCERCAHIEVPAGLARLPDGRSIYEREDAVFTADGNAEYYLDDTNLLAAQAKLRYVRRFCHAGTLIDVGASYGHFLSVAAATFDARGFEMSPEAVAFSRNTLQVDNSVGSIYQWPVPLETAVDVVTCWDVIEHLEDPGGALAVMADHVKPGGWLFLSTPDAGSVVARAMGSRWHYLDPVQHINVFSRGNLAALIEAHGFRVRDGRSFGRQYRVSYILNRLAYLHPHQGFRGVVGAITRATRPFHRLRVPITLGDVMGIAAQRA